MPSMWQMAECYFKTLVRQFKKCFFWFMKCSLSSEDFQFRNDQNDLFSQEAIVTGRYLTITYKAYIIKTHIFSALFSQFCKISTHGCCYKVCQVYKVSNKVCFTFVIWLAISWPVLRALTRARAATKDLLTDEANFRGTSPKGLNISILSDTQLRYIPLKLYWPFRT